MHESSINAQHEQLHNKSMASQKLLQAQKLHYLKAEERAWTKLLTVLLWSWNRSRNIANVPR